MSTILPHTLPRWVVRQARVEDALHWRTHRRPISAETLRKRLHIGARTARHLVAQLRTGPNPRLDSTAEDDQDETGSEALPTTAEADANKVTVQFDRAVDTLEAKIPKVAGHPSHTKADLLTLHRQPTTWSSTRESVSP
ncbi:hypothetical protein [Frankia tisae]|uniref:hypothetical protein n=1 Tax=Frankia tisae TaxID=2950104 RepID=UPI0021C1A5D5|nr:hypothetical protein [Frankia tisae]